MKINIQHIALLFMFLLASCTEQELVSPPSPQAGADGCRFTVSIPVPMVSTRAMGEVLTQAYVTSLPFFVLEFDENGFFEAFLEAKAESFEPDAGGASGKGTYTVNLPISNERRILHFVLGMTEEDWNGFTDGEGFTASDTETDIFSRLTVGDNKDVYWQRVEVEHIAKTEDGQYDIPPLTDDGYTVKLVRNFAQVTVTVADNLQSKLQDVSFVVLNQYDRGTVAPYTGSGFASFDLSGQQGATDYDRFTAANPGFGGNNPPRDVAHPVDGEPAEADFVGAGGSKYVYERNQDNSDSPAYVLVKANYQGGYDEDSGEGYYKLDIVKFDQETFITSYLNLYRNFHYKVNITAVAGKGYETIEEAMEAVASNNISASVEVSQVNKIEDGLGHSLEVSELNIMLTSTEPYTLTYDYVVTENNREYHRNDKQNVKVTPSEDNKNGYNLDAVAKIEYEEGIGDEPGKITITPVNPLPQTMQTQEFVVATESGLSRRVTVNVREKFEFEAVDCDNVVDQIGAEMTLVVRLPENMPISAFPLTLDIEPEKKSIYPDVSKNRIPVTSDGYHTFSYLATVTYNDYRQNPVFFFHFKTNMAASATGIKVTNDNFVDGNTSFENVYRKYPFLDVELSGTNLHYDNNAEKYLFNKYDTEGEKVTLTFTLHTVNDGYDPVEGDEHIVEIFADYFSFDEKGDRKVETTTGTFTVREDGRCILYKPNSVYGEQSITFTVNRDLASETIQLSSMDHYTYTLDYGTPPKTVQLQYYNYRWQSVPNNTVIYIYQDLDGDGSADADELVAGTEENIRTNGSGQITLESFAGVTMDDVLIFQYRRNNNSSRYSVAITVNELLDTNILQLRQ